MAGNMVAGFRFARSVGGTALDVHKTARLVLAVLTLAVTILTGWKLGPAWGLVAFLFAVCVLLTVTGVRLQKQVDTKTPEFSAVLSRLPNHFLGPGIGLLVHNHGAATEFQAQLMEIRHASMPLQPLPVTLRWGSTPDIMCCRIMGGASERVSCFQIETAWMGVGNAHHWLAFNPLGRDTFSVEPFGTGEIALRVRVFAVNPEGYRDFGFTVRFDEGHAIVGFHEDWATVAP